MEAICDSEYEIEAVSKFLSSEESEKFDELLKMESRDLTNIIYGGVHMQNMAAYVVPYRRAANTAFLIRKLLDRLCQLEGRHSIVKSFAPSS